MSYDIKYVDQIVVRQQADQWGGRRFNGKTGRYTTSNGETKDYTPDVGDSASHNNHPDVSPLPHAYIKASLSAGEQAGDTIYDMACVGYNARDETPKEKFVLGSFGTVLNGSYGALTGKGSGTRLSAQSWDARMDMWRDMLGTCAALPGSDGLTGVYCNAYVVIDVVVGEDIGGTGPDGTEYPRTGLNHVFAKVEDFHIQQSDISADTGYTSDMYIGLDPWTYSYTGDKMVVTGNPKNVGSYSVDVGQDNEYYLELTPKPNTWESISAALKPGPDGNKIVGQSVLNGFGLIDLGPYDSSRHARTMYVSKEYGDTPQGVDRGVMYVSVMGSYGVSDPVYANPAPILFPSSFDPHVFDVAYYPFAIRKDGSWKSANRTGGSTTIRKSSSWRDVKNHTEESEAGDNKGFYRSGGKWVKAPLLG
mgnify:CR=1 FL=1